jgi:hypothetical protein
MDFDGCAPSASPAPSSSSLPTTTPVATPSFSPSSSFAPSFNPSALHSSEPSTSFAPSPTLAVPVCYHTAQKVKIEASTDQQIQVFEVKVVSEGVNVAMEKSTHQSSTFSSAAGKNFVSDLAVDGNLYTFSHTDDASPFWEVDLEDSFSIHSVEIFNRWCRDSSDPKDCFCRLSDATVSIIDSSGSILAKTSTNNTCGMPILNLTFPAPCLMPTLSPSPSVQECYPRVQKIKLESTTGQNINMFEFQAFSEGANVASSGTARQSSTFIGGVSFDASLALDGDTTTFSHTDDTEAFWEVDLGEAHPIESVAIKNRWCRKPNDPKHCLCRLSGVNLTLTDDFGSLISFVETGDTCGTKTLEYEFEKSPAFCSDESYARRVLSPKEQDSARSNRLRQLGKRPRCS